MGGVRGLSRRCSKEGAELVYGRVEFVYGVGGVCEEGLRLR